MPTWEEFKQKHILNPNNHQGYESWDSGEWNDWLKNRLAHFGNRGGQVFGKKKKNSIIIATSQEVLDDFQHPSVQPGKNWSQRTYPIRFLETHGNSSGANIREKYSVQMLHNHHFLAVVAIEDGEKRPVHYCTQSEIKRKLS